MDSDDVIKKNALETISKYLKKIDILSFSFDIIKNDNKYQFYIYLKKEYKSSVNGDTILKLNPRVSVWNFVYKKKLITDNKLLFNNEIWLFEDNLFNIEVLNHAKKIIQINKPLYSYRENRIGSAMLRTDYENHISSIFLILEQLKSIKLDILSQNRMNQIMTSFILSIIYYIKIIEKKNRTHYINQIVNYYQYITSENLTFERKYELFFIKIFKHFYFRIYNSKIYKLIKKVFINVI